MEISYVIFIFWNIETRENVQKNLKDVKKFTLFFLCGVHKKVSPRIFEPSNMKEVKVIIYLLETFPKLPP